MDITTNTRKVSSGVLDMRKAMTALRAVERLPDRVAINRRTQDLLIEAIPLREASEPLGNSFYGLKIEIDDYLPNRVAEFRRGAETLERVELPD